MKTQKIIQPKMHHTSYSCSLALKLVIITFSTVFVSSSMAWSQIAEWTVYNTANSGMPYNGVIELAIDAQGDVWIGTGKWNAWEGGGLAKFDGENWTVYKTTNSGLPNNDHTGLTIDPQGNIWSGTESGLARFDGENWTVYNTGNSGLKVNLVASPSFDAQGNLWIGSWDGGLAKFDGVNWLVYTRANSGLPNNRPWVTTFDAEGNLWIGTNGGGLVKFDGTRWTVYNQSNSGLPNNVVSPLCFDSQENLWIGTDGGLAKFDEQDWTVYNTNNSGLPHNRINDLEIDNQGSIWIGTAGGGLAMFNKRKWVVYNTDNSGLPDNIIHSIAIDDTRQNIWIGTQSGGLAVFRLQPDVDFNDDGIVDIKDLLLLIESWRQNDPLCDIGPNVFGDGVVDEADLEVLMSYWGQPIEDPSLVAHWTLDEVEGEIAYDSAGVNDAFIIGSSVWQPAEGKRGGAIELDGIDDYIKTKFVLSPAEGLFSAFAWIKGGTPGQVIISQVDGFGWTGATWLGMDALNGNLMTGLVPPPLGRFIPAPLESQSQIVDGQWHHIGFVWDGAYRYLYVDGTEVAKDTQALAPLKYSNGGLHIGTSKKRDAGTFFSGLIDDVRIYKQALTADEIAAMAQ